MSAESDKVRAAFAEQLANFDDKLYTKSDNVEMLADIQQAIGNLLAAAGGSEGEIRRILQERYDAGALRKETLQLVKSMLDRYVSENLDTSPTQPPPSAAPRMTADNLDIVDSATGDDVFASTAVIPSNLAPANTAESRVQVGSLLRDRFMLQEKISGGSMGVVYKALDRRLAEAGSDAHWVALKVLSPQLAEDGQALRALQQEAAKGRCLVHPNIVRFLDLDRDDDLYFLVMEWLDGRTLADILDSKDAAVIDNDAAFRIVRQIADALDYAHRCGIVHADVKPGNIMIMPNGDAKLFDFGIARVRQKHVDTDFDPAVMGALTPAYSSMQVLTGEDPTPTDDVFSLACLLYRLIAGYRVFGPRNAAEASQEGMEPQRLQAMSDNQWRALKKALSYARVTRFKSVSEFMNALDASAAENISIEAPDRFEEEEHSGSGKWVAALVLLVGLLGVAGYQSGFLDPLLDAFISESTAPLLYEADVQESELPQPEIQQQVIHEPEVQETMVAEPNVPQPIVEKIEPQAEIGATQIQLVDYSKLAVADAVVQVSLAAGASDSVSITLREDGRPVIVDFVRQGDLSSALSLRLEEIAYTGNRSPWAAGEYALSESGIVYFPVGQERGRVTLTMASDTRRETDQQSILRLGQADLSGSELATITVTLEDDDQRAFESRLPMNTIAFAARQTIIRETDPAVQVDLVRFNPDDAPIVVEFTISDITATEGEDYFAPSNLSVSFGPRQRSARLLIPLVQDSDVEGDEAFAVELVGVPDISAMDVYQRIVIVIRDDQSPPR